jgi:iron(III) transport system ATP-binding protein
MVRPEQLMVSVGEGRGAPGTVSSVSYTGHDAVLGLLLDNGTVCESRVTATGLLSAGTRVTVQIAGTCLAYPV